MRITDAGHLMLSSAAPTWQHCETQIATYL